MKTRTWIFAVTRDISEAFVEVHFHEENNKYVADNFKILSSNASFPLWMHFGLKKKVLNKLKIKLDYIEFME